MFLSWAFPVLLISLTITRLLAQTTPDHSYAELVALNVSCSPKDTCDRELSKSRDLSALSDRNCACDSVCIIYGDCCIDAPARASKVLPPIDGPKGWICQNLTQFGGIIMKSSCPANWTGAPEVRNKCESTDDDTNSGDPMSIMPVTNRVNGTTYRNYHCAFCNSDVSDLAIWMPRLEFDNLDQYNRTFQNITGQYVKDNLEYETDSKSWGIKLMGQDYQSYFYSAKLYPMIPKEVESLVRPCRKSLIADCPNEWTDLEITTKCLAYEAAIYLHDLRENLAFRNVHCAICNNIQLDRLTCRPPAGKSDVETRTFNFQAFSVIVDFNNAKGNQVGMKERCPSGEVYDPFQKLCRNVVCGFPGYILQNGKCVLQPRPTTTTAIPTTKSTTPDPTIYIIDFPTPAPDGLPDPFEAIEVNDTTVSSTTDMNVSNMYTNDDLNSTTPFYSEDFIQCLKVPIAPENLQQFSNGTIYVAAYEKYYDPLHYLLFDNQILVCAFFINETDAQQAKFSIVLSYITVVGLSISMFCIILHLVAFVIVPDMQNLSTRNLSSLALSLFFAYFCFMIGNISTLSKVSCTTLAITTCYFFLVSFFWMNTMSYDVWRTLRLATLELRVSSGKQWKRFFVYSIYSWGVPAAIVTAAIVVDNVDGVPADYKPGFGVNVCWFSERKALLIFFASPLISIVVINLGLFISSTKMILSTTQATASNYTASSRRNFKLYLRLGVMMGLTWSFGVLAGYLNLETLWYVFVVLNTLQGLFIFVAFTCNRKVRKYLSERVQACRGGRHAYRSSLNSGSGYNSNSTFPSSNSSSKTASSNLSDTKCVKKTPVASPLASTPSRPPTSFKHLQAGMETLY